MGRDAHHRAMAVTGQNVVGHPNGHGRAGQGVAGSGPRENAALRPGRGHTLNLADALAGGDVIGHGRGLRRLDNRRQQRMFRRQRQKSRAKQGVRPGGKDGQLMDGLAHRQLKNDLRAGRAANPVALHLLDRLRPINFGQIGQQPLSIGRDTEIPLAQPLLADRLVTAPTIALLHLFIGQNSLAGGAPPLIGLGLIGQALPEQQAKQPLGPAVIGRICGVDLPRPVVGAGQELHLPPVGIGKNAGALLRMNGMIDGIVFRGQAEGIPAHGVEHIVAAHPLKAGINAGGDVVTAVAHRQSRPGRVREEI